jgi:hypothetical protein
MQENSNIHPIDNLLHHDIVINDYLIEQKKSIINILDSSSLEKRMTFTNEQHSLPTV